MKRRNKAPPAMRVAMVFGGSVIAERTLDSPRDVVLGDGANAVMPLPDGAISARELTLLREVDGGWELALHPSMRGALWIDGRRRAVADLDARRVSLGEADYGVVTIGAVAFFFQRVGAAPPMGRRWLALDPNAYAGLGLSAFLHLAALLLLFVAQREAPSTTLELPTDLLRRFLVTPPAATYTPPTPADVSEPTREAEGGDEGAPRPERGDRARQSRRPSTVTRTSRAPNVGLLRAIQGDDGTGNALAAALEGPDIAGLLDRTRIGGTRAGPGRGLGLRGTGHGDHGPAERYGGGDGDTRVGGDEAERPAPRRRRRAEHDIDITPGSPVVDDDYPPQWIQRVVLRNRAAIRYCYENGLQRQPSLRGRVDMSWRIEADGRAGSVRVLRSTLRNARVEGCISRQIRRWRFPRPEHGRVGVQYPFILGVGG